jgi:molecular chaperone DnaK (HSP70)
MTSRTTTTTTATDPSNSDPNTATATTAAAATPGIWVGIDLGTSNCACAVWDSTRGGSKWIRLPGIAPLEASGKLGRIVPSVIVLNENYCNQDANANANANAYLVGAQALQKEEQDEQTANTATANTTTTTLIQSVKRLLGKKWKELDPDFVESLPLELVPEDDNGDGDAFSIRVVIDNREVLVTPVECAALLLRSIRIAADAYLVKFAKKKYLDIPGGTTSGTTTTTTTATPTIQHVVVGVPAHFSVAQQKLVEQAAKMAGFATVSTLMESTAAAMAYGLSFTHTNTNDDDDGSNTNNNTGKTKPQPQTIMVVDMGGGTTDVTIATRSDDEAYQVVVTEGDARLGGDDMDQAILEFVLLQQQWQQHYQHQQYPPLSKQQRRHLLSSCKAAKEALCNPETKRDSHVISVTLPDDNGNDKTTTNTKTHTKTKTAQLTITITITQDDLEQILAPWICRAKTLIQTALHRLSQQSNNNNNTSAPVITVTEVVLVGGTTRVPAIRNMLKSLLIPTATNDDDDNNNHVELELCTSLNPMASVAQGLAIQAALKSKLVPKHELRSALMLDSTPHAIGVDVGQGVFCEVIPRNTRLPAMGSATFTLASKEQPGVSIAAVERIDENNNNNNSNNNNSSNNSNKDDAQTATTVTLEPLGDFTFLLRRLPPKDLETLQHRTIQVGMQVDHDGKFIVSIFDEKDPEQVRKKERWQKQQQLAKNNNNTEAVAELGYIADLVMAESGVSSEQFFLLAACLGLFLMYIGVKIAFAGMIQEGAGIL